MNRFAFGTAMSYLHTSSYKIETFKNQDNETSITASSPMQKKWQQAIAATYRFRINPVSSFVHPSLLLFSSFYRSRFQKRKQYGNYTETICNRSLEEGRKKRGRYLVEAWRKEAQDRSHCFCLEQTCCRRKDGTFLRARAR